MFDRFILQPATGLIDMKLVQNSMDNGCQHDPHNSDEDQTTEKRVSRGEQFHASGLERIDGTHAAQDH